MRAQSVYYMIYSVGGVVEWLIKHEAIVAIDMVQCSTQHT